MFDFVSESETTIRIAVFLVIFMIFALLEIVLPRRKLEYSIFVRWLNNLGISLINIIIVRVILPVTLLFVATSAESSGIGLLNIVELPFILSIIFAVLLMDLAIYLQHIIFHKVEFLWRLHRMHHADLDFDVTTGLRFHPVEILLSFAVKVVVVLFIGAPLVAVLLFEILLNSTSIFNHANICIPKKVDSLLRKFVVTPDMHRVHHSIIREETDSNFGFNVPWWDYIFKTYRAQPAAGHTEMAIGIENFRQPRELWLDRLMLQPFKKTD